MRNVVSVLKALADQNRLRILALLRAKPACVCELAHILGVSQPAVSKHLRKLKQAGVVEDFQSGLWTDYRLNLKSKAVQVLEMACRELCGDATLRGDKKKRGKTDRKNLCCP